MNEFGFKDLSVINSLASVYRVCARSQRSRFGVTSTDSACAAHARVQRR
jgi:hypothetical protein